LSPLPTRIAKEFVCMTSDVMEGYLLSPQQLRLWQAQRGFDGHPFTTTLRLRIDGPLDRARLGRAIRRVVNRHDVFRTTYQSIGGAPLQLVRPAVTGDLLIDDAAAAAAAGDYETARFDLAAGPMLRALLWRVEADQHVVVIAFPAIAGDAKTAEIVAGEIARAYAADGGAGKSGGEDEEIVQYLQYSEYQQEWRKGDEARELQDRWAALTLSTDAPPLELAGFRGLASPSPLPSMSPPTAGATTARFAIGRHPIVLDAARIAALRDTCAHLGVDLESGVAALWQVLLARFGDQTRFRLVHELDGRTFDELAGLPGAFARIVPVGVDLDLTRSFTEIATGVQRRLDDLRACQDGIVVGASGSHEQPREPDAAGFTFVALEDHYDAGDCRMRLDDAWSCQARFGLRLHAVAIGARLDLAVECDCDAVDEALARQLAESYAVLAAACAADPQLAAGRATLLSDAQRQEIVSTWNQTASAPLDRRGSREAGAPARFAHERFEAQARQQPHGVALRTSSGNVTFEELNIHASRIAAWLQARGARPDAIIAIVATPSLGAVAGILGVLKSGAAYLPIDPSLPAERIAFMLHDAEALAVLTEQEPAADCDWAQQTPHRLALTGDWFQTAQASEPVVTVTATAAAAPLRPEHTAYVIYTSGSTGTPKGVVITHGGLANYLDWCESAYVSDGVDIAGLTGDASQRAAGSGAPLHSSLSFDLSVTSLFGPLAAGQPITLAPADARVEGLTQLLREPTDFAWIKLTPGHARLLGERLGASGLRGRARKLIVGGEALTASDLAAWRSGAPDTVIINEYGPTEAVVGCAVHELTQAAEDPVPIGRPIRHARLHVLDANLDPVPPGVVGELFIGGEGLARGYLRRPGLTAERFIPDPFAGSDPAVPAGARLYRTGDLARYREDGVLLYHGRRDDQIKLRGYRIELGEIEAALVQHPGVREAVVVLRGVEDDAPRLVAYFTQQAEAQAPPSVSDFRAFLGARLPDYMLPAMFVPLRELPLTRHGKVDRRALPEADHAERGQAYAGPRTLEEEALAEIWAKVLGLGRVGIDEDYFVLGGDSIRAIQVAGLAGQHGFDVTIDRLFRHRTIRELARTLRSGDDGAAPVSRATEPFSLVTADDRARMPEDVVDAYPLSALQAGMIFHREYHPESAIYHDIFGYHLRMPLDLPKLEAAVRALVERHPALRTAVHLDGFSEPLQLVHRTAPLPLGVTDIREQSQEEQERTLRAWLEAEKLRGFAEHERPMLRFHVHIRSAGTFELFLSFHHAVLDGWSDANMLLELAISYQALLDGEAIPFSAPQTAYREFIALERQVQASAEARQFWKDKLSGAAPLVLPRWHASAPAAAGATGDADGSRGVTVQRVPISNETSDALRRLARSLAVPLKSVLLAAHMRLLASLGGVSDIVSSLSVAGRPETVDANQVLGLHINSTPIRIRLDGGSWIDLIHAAFREERDALPYRRYPLAEIQRLAGVRRLVETSFYYTHYHNIEPLARLPQFEILDRLIYEETSFALVANFNLDPFRDELGLTLACDQTQFDTEQRQWLGDYYERAIAALVADPSARYELADLMTEDERARLLAFNDTAAASSTLTAVEAETRTGETGERLVLLHERIAEQARRVPNARAVACGERSLTYAELDAQAERIATQLRAAGAGPDRLVGLCVSRSVEMVAGMLGVLKAGAAYLPLDPEYPQDRLDFMVRDARPHAVLASAPFVGRMRAAGASVLDLDAAIATMDGATAALPAFATMPALTPENLAYVIYTSGSTGRPKGTLVSHANLAHSTAARLAYYRDPVAAYLLLSSYAFDSSVAGLFWTLATGGTLVIPQAEVLRDPEAILDLLDRHAVSHTLALPSLHAALLEAASDRQLPHLRAVIVAGEACAPHVVARHHRLWPGVALFNEYGPTEATVWSTVAMCEPAADAGVVPIGGPIPGARVYVLDAHGRLAPLGVPGELHVGGPGVTRGYLERPDATVAAFLPDPFSPVPGARMYRTGDACRFRYDGQLEFLGRLDHQVKIRGHRVELGEIEAALRADADIEDAAVLAQEEAPGDVRLVAYIVAPKKPAADRQRLRDTLQRRLPEFMLPSRFLFLDALPRTPNGKLDRAALSGAGAESEEAERAYAPPSDAVESALAAIWAQVLKVDRVGIEDDFFSLGGDSILSIQIIARAKRAGLRVTPADLFQCRTIAALRPRVQVHDDFARPAEGAAAEAAAEARTPAGAASGPVAVGLSEQQVAGFLKKIGGHAS
jgi:nonribosomal peptide synthetase protein BlmX